MGGGFRIAGGDGRARVGYRLLGESTPTLVGPTLRTATILVLAATGPCLRLRPYSPEEAEEVRQLLREAYALSQAIDGMRRAAGVVRLKVNGEEVPAAAVDRAFVYIYGRPYIERKVRDFLVADEIEARRKSGQVVGDLRIGDEEVMKEVASMKEQLQGQIQGGFGVKAVLRLQGMDDTGFADEQASLLLFDKVFIPEDPTKWSETTVQALASQGGQDFVDKTMKGLQEHREKNPTEPMPAFYRTIFRQWITKALKESSSIKTASYGLPPDVVLSVNNRPLPTAEAYPTVARMVTAVDRERVLRWIVWTTATRQALEERGAYLSDEEFEEGRESLGLEPPYRGTHHGVEDLATLFKKFPAYDLYCEYWRLRTSFQRAIEGTITEEALEAHRDRVRDFYGDGTVDAQAILLSALDYTDFSWKGPDAFEKSKARAEEVMGELKRGVTFEEAIDRYSEFFDPPAPASGQQAPQVPRPNRGRFGPQSKNQLKTLLGESEFDEVVRGYSIGEILFHDAPIGEAIGPVRGPFGYYVGRVLARHAAERSIDLARENERNLVREDYVSRRFLEWSNEAVARTRIEVR